jgi:hypothetical protein
MKLSPARINHTLPVQAVFADGKTEFTSKEDRVEI